MNRKFNTRLLFLQIIILFLLLGNPVFSQEVESSYDVSGLKDKNNILPAGVVATWQNGKLTEGEWKSHLDKIPWTKKGNPLNPEDISWKHTLVQDYVSHQLILNDVIKEKLDKSKECIDYLEREETKLLTDMLHQKEVIEKITPSQEEMKKYYEEHKEMFATPETFSIRHIFVDTSAARKTEAEIKSAHKKILDAYDKLKKGGKFEEVAKEYSESDVERRGQVNGPFRVNNPDPKQRILKDLEDTALSLKVGEYSSIITTKHGYNIIYLEEHRLAYQNPFDEVKQSVQSVIQREKQPLREKEVIDLALAQSKVQKHYELLDDSAAKGNSKLLEMTGYSLTLDQFNELLKPYGTNITKDQKIQFLDGTARNKVLVNYAKKLRYDKDPKIVEELNKLKNDFLVNLWLDKTTRARLKVTEKDMLEFYNNNSSRFYSQKEINASNIYIKAVVNSGDSPVDRMQAMTMAKDTIQWILGEIRKGADFEEMAKKYSTIPNAKDGGKIGWIHMGPMGRRFDIAAFKLNSGQITEPVEMQDGFQIIKVNDIRDARQLSYEESKDNVKQSTEQYKYQQVRNDIIQEKLKKVKLKYDLTLL